MNVEFLKFYGLAMRITESEMDISISDNEAQPFARNLLGEFEKTGLPQTKQKGWLRDRLKASLISVDASPKTVESMPLDWPFQGDMPMIFIGSHEITNNEVSATHLGKDRILHIFGARVATENGISLNFCVKEQVRGL